MVHCSNFMTNFLLNFSYHHYHFLFLRFLLLFLVVSSSKHICRCVADGGVFDFLQATLCHLPSVLINMYYNAPNDFNQAIAAHRKSSLSLDFLLSFSALGFGTNTASEVFDAFQEYEMSTNIQNITRPIVRIFSIYFV